MHEGGLLLSDLNKIVKNTSRKKITAASWISDASWRLADRRTALGWTHGEAVNAQDGNKTVTNST